MDHACARRGPERPRVIPPSAGKTVDAAGGTSSTKPAALAGLPESRQVGLDVREDIRQGREPFARIMATVKALGPDQVLVLRAPFEPHPLYEVLGRRGFSHWTDCRGPDDWSVWFYRDAASAGSVTAPEAAVGGGPAPAGGMICLDVRGLEAPLPMVRVLESLETLAPGQRLEVLHERRPLFLYPQLDERGFSHETDEPEPGLVRIVIRRTGGDS